LKFESVVEIASQGILERPILFGKFLADSEGTLRAMPIDAANWNGETWPKLGIPEGFGPLDYEFQFELNEAQTGKTWQLQLSQFIGVAEVWINDEEIGRSSWEPRVLPLPALPSGEHRIRLRLHGSWNNVFSTLNRLENGLSESVKLVSK